VSVRLRVTLVFVAVMALVLTGAGLFLYLRLGAELDDGIERNLEARAGVFSERGDDTAAQVLDPSGRVIRTSDEAGKGALLTPAQTRRALRHDLFVDRRVDDDRFRLLATEAGGRVVVVGESLDDRDEAVASLGTLLLIGGPITLLLAALAGYGATAAALRPVERMRARAAAIEATDRAARLPLPPADDELGRLGATLNAMLDRIEAAFARERTFVADASHELRTPLAILKTELELALGRGRTNEELTAALRSAAEETDRLVALAEDLLVIARSDQGQLPIRPRELRAAELLERVRDRRAPGATIEPGADGLVVRGDPLRLEQALGNLLDNALRYGGAAIELAAEDRNGVVRLHVRDDGPGLPDDLEAFERFTRGDSARSRGGAGLGLAIVAAIARAHGGGAGAAARPGGGADVWIELPGQSS
jgi:two-component system OmpR family sensor kinase